MITRQQYMADSKNLFYAYYCEIALEACIVLPEELKKKCRQLLKDGDEHFNMMPLQIWDRISVQYKSQLSKALKDRGDYFTMCNGVCSTKALMYYRLKGEEE